MKKQTKVLEEKLNNMVVDSNGSFNIAELLDEMSNATTESPELIIRFVKDENDKVQVKVRQRSGLNIEKMNKKTLEELLEEYQEKLSEIEDEEPDEADEEAYEEWEEEVDEIEEVISEIEERLEELEEKALKNSIDLPRPKQKDCTTERYSEFFDVAKRVLVDNADEKQLIEYLANNKDVKESIVYVCELIEKKDSVSVAMIQRCMQIGYSKAGQIVDGLESIGISTPFNGMNGRKVVKEQLEKLKTYLG